MSERKPIFDKFTRQSPMNCLRCVHCQLLPDTNFALSMRGPDAKGPRRETMMIVPIRCEKAGYAPTTAKNKGRKFETSFEPGERPAYIWEACPIADGRLCNTTQTHAARAKSGDRAMCMTPAERLFLKEFFWDTPEALLEKATLRLWKDLRRAARRAGLQRSPTLVLEQIRKGTSAARSKVKAPRFNDDQRAYIRECFEHGDWPTRGMNWNAEKRAKDAEIRGRVVAGVAERGAAFSWQSIISHANEQQAGSLRWRKQWDKKNRVKGVYRQEEK